METGLFVQINSNRQDTNYNFRKYTNINDTIRL